MKEISLPGQNLDYHLDPFFEALVSGTPLPHHFAEIAEGEGIRLPKAVAVTALGVGLSLAPSIAPFTGGKARAEAISVKDAAKPSAVEQSEPLPPSSLVLIGDSLMVGRESAGVADKYKAAGINLIAVDALGGRQTVYGPCDTNAGSANCEKWVDGIRAIDRHGTDIGSATAVMLALGTNDRVNELEEELLRAARTAHLYGVIPDGKAPLIVLPEYFGESGNVAAAQKNEILQRVVQTLQVEGISAAVLPVKGFVDTTLRPEGRVAKDEVHLTSAGYGELVDFEVAQSLPLINDYQNKLFPPAPELPTASTPEPLPPIQPPTVGPQAPSKAHFFSLDLRYPAATLSLPLPRLDTVATVITVLEPQPVVLDFDTQAPASEYVPGLEPLPPAVQAPNAVTLPLELPIIEQPQIISAPLPPVASIVSLEPLPTSDSKPAKPEPLQPVIEPAPPAIPEQPTNSPIRNLYSVNENNVLDDTKLREFIRSGGAGFQQAAPSANFPDGTYYRIPDSIPGLPYNFADHTTNKERFGAERTAALALIIADKVAELQIKYPELQGIDFHDVTSTHKEHRNGGDIDVGLLTNEEARNELFLFLIGLRNPDGSAYIHHLVTGDQELERLGNEYLNHLGYDRPNLIYQSDHGEYPGGTAHWHISLDGGTSGPYEEPGAHIGLNESGEVPLVGIDPPPTVIPETDSPPSPISLDIGSLLDITPTNIAITLPPITSIITLPGSAPTDEDERLVPETNLEIDLPDVTNIIEDIDDEDKEKDKDKPIVAEVPERPNEEVEEQPPEALPSSENPTEQPQAPPAEGVTPQPEVPLRDVFTDETVQAMLPGAPAENIQTYTPLILSALQEFGIADTQIALYAFATIRPETGGFAPIPEYGLGKGKQYGIPDPETGQTYYGRGFIQLTWRSNYEAAGAALGLDLVNNPDLALDPTNAARILAWYLAARQEEIRSTLDAGDLRAARQIVNGQKAHGLQAFEDAYYAGNHLVTED